MFTIVYRPNFFLNIPIPCYIFIKQMSLFVEGVFCLIISYLQIKSYNVLNYNNCSADWSFLLSVCFVDRCLSFCRDASQKSIIGDAYFLTKLWQCEP
jgi:hypothetical protein